MTRIPQILTPPEAVERLAAGGLVAFPTETSWGLAADASCAEAVARLRRWKRRAADHPLPVLVAGPDDLLRLLDRPRPEALKLARAFWPGPLTLVVPSRVGLAPGVAGPPGAADQQGTLGLRCSSHPVAAELVRLAYGRGLGPITATSFNRTGEAPCATRDEARRASDAEIALVEGPDAGGGATSTVVDLCGEVPRIVRQGAVAARRIHTVLDGSTDCESTGPLEEAMHSAWGGNS